jgi:hypothetical protein
VRLQGSLHLGWCSVPILSAYSRKYRQKEPADTSHRVRSGPRREVCQRNADELGELPRQRVGEGLSRSAGPRVRVSFQLVTDLNRICRLENAGRSKPSPKLSHQSHWPQGSPPCGTRVIW